MLVDPLFVYFSFSFSYFLSVCDKKDVQMLEKIILTSKWHGKHMFAG